jgi:hypothetical protein
MEQIFTMSVEDMKIKALEVDFAIVAQGNAVGYEELAIYETEAEFLEEVNRIINGTHGKGIIFTTYASGKELDLLDYVMDSNAQRLVAVSNPHTIH